MVRWRSSLEDEDIRRLQRRRRGQGGKGLPFRSTGAVGIEIKGVCCCVENDLMADGLCKSGAVDMKRRAVQQSACQADKDPAIQHEPVHSGLKIDDAVHVVAAKRGIKDEVICPGPTAQNVFAITAIEDVVASIPVQNIATTIADKIVVTAVARIDGPILIKAYFVRRLRSTSPLNTE